MKGGVFWSGFGGAIIGGIITIYIANKTIKEATKNLNKQINLLTLTNLR